MADKYDFQAERPGDVIVAPTPSRQLIWEMTHEDVSKPRKAPSDIPSDKLKFPPRIINLLLESETRISVDADSMTWHLNMHGVGPLAKGSVLTWSALSIDIDSVSVPLHMEVALSGFDTHTYRTTPGPYDFRTGVVLNTSDPSVAELVGTCSLSATLKSPETILTNSRVTLHRLSGGSVWGSGTAARVALTITEPGAGI